MIQKESLLKVADNSGAKEVKVISLIGSTRKRFAYLGDMVKVTVKKATPGGNVKKSAVVNAVLVRARKEHRRPSGCYVKFDDNAVVILNNSGVPECTRVFGPVASELKTKGKFDQILSMAPQVL